MKAHLFSVFAPIALLSGANQAASQISIYPPEVSEGIWLDLRKFNEGPLADGQVPKNLSSRIRFSITGITTLSAVIRIDEKKAGGFRGVAKLQDRKDGKISRTTVRFSPSKKDMAELQTLISQSNLWSTYPQYYVLSDDEICIDGHQIILERADGSGYRFSESNAQCTLNRDVAAVVKKIIALSGQTKLRGLLAPYD